MTLQDLFFIYVIGAYICGMVACMSDSVEMVAWVVAWPLMLFIKTIKEIIRFIIK